MIKGSHLHIALTLTAILLLAGCADDANFNRQTQYLGDNFHQIKSKIAKQFDPKVDDVSYWNGDEYKGPASIKISLGDQKAYFYKGKQLVGVSIISTGREGFDTPIGSFHIIQKDKDHVSSRFGDYDNKDGSILKKEIDRDKDPMPKGAVYDGASMPFFMRIVNGTGMHQGYLPGFPASHGCIRMPGFMAENFFYSVEVGTPVTIVK